MPYGSKVHIPPTNYHLLVAHQPHTNNLGKLASHTHMHTHTNMHTYTCTHSHKHAHTHMHTQTNHTQILQNKLNDLIKSTPPLNWEENQNQWRHSPQSSLLAPQTEEWSAKHVHWRPLRSSLVKGYPLSVHSSLSHTCSAKQESQSLVLSNQRRKTQSGERHTDWADDVSWQRQQCWIKVTTLRKRLAWPSSKALGL